MYCEKSNFEEFLGFVYSLPCMRVLTSSLILNFLSSVISLNQSKNSSLMLLRKIPQSKLGVSGMSCILR